MKMNSTQKNLTRVIEAKRKDNLSLAIFKYPTGTKFLSLYGHQDIVSLKLREGFITKLLPPFAKGGTKI